MVTARTARKQVHHVGNEPPKIARRLILVETSRPRRRGLFEGVARALARRSNLAQFQARPQVVSALDNLRPCQTLQVMLRHTAVCRAHETCTNTSEASGFQVVRTILKYVSRIL